MKLQAKLDLCGKLSKIESVTSEGVMTDACATAVDALRIMSRHQCARDLVEEFVCVKVLPLRANQSWFVVKDDEKYRAHGLKGLGMDVKQAWSKVLWKSDTPAAGLRSCIRRLRRLWRNSLGLLGLLRIRR